MRNRALIPIVETLRDNELYSLETMNCNKWGGELLLCPRSIFALFSCGIYDNKNTQGKLKKTKKNTRI